MFIVFQDFLMVEEILFSPQVKRSVITSNKLLYLSELSHELLNDLRVRILGNLGKIQNLEDLLLGAQIPEEKEILSVRIKIS